jgi:hypothetical protein
MIENHLKKEVRDSLLEDLSDKRRAREDMEDYNRYQDDEDEITFDPDVSQTPPLIGMLRLAMC